MLLKDRIAFITGGAKGIGRAIAQDMCREGAKVIIGDVSENAGTKTANEIKSSGGRACFKQINVTNFQSLKITAQEIREEIGHIDILVVNAGISIKRPIEDLDEVLWDKVMDVNLKGSFLTVKAFLSHIETSRHGKIIFISSGSALTGTGGGIQYVASKAGQHAMVFNLAKELGPKGVNVNAIAPRAIQSKMLETLYPDEKSRMELTQKIPIRKIGQPEDVAYMASFLCSDKASYLHGQVILLDGGRTNQ